MPSKTPAKRAMERNQRKRARRESFAQKLEKAAHQVRYGHWNHRPQFPSIWNIQITEDPFGDVYEIKECVDCRLKMYGKHLGNVLHKEVDGEMQYIGAFEADRLDRFLALNKRYVLEGAPILTRFSSTVS